MGPELGWQMPALAMRMLMGPKVAFAESMEELMEDSSEISPETVWRLGFEENGSGHRS